jgi:hypothetical protein
MLSVVAPFLLALASILFFLHKKLRRAYTMKFTLLSNKLERFLASTIFSQI